jgi:hypothetical protein
MVLSLDELASQLNPTNTALFLGAGASIPSGAPSGDELARLLSKEIAGADESLGDGLAETCSIIENSHGRERIVEVIRERLGPLTPTGGLTALPAYELAGLFTTNFDDLTEKSYRSNSKRLTLVRSNYEYGAIGPTYENTLFKIHGSIEQDFVDGYKFGMVLTENDYNSARMYRQALFRTLGLLMISRDVLVVGYSLRDTQLKAELDEAVGLHREQGAPGRLFLLIHEEDINRALLQEAKGYVVAFGGIDELTHSLSTTRPSARASSPALVMPGRLPVAIRPTTMEIGHASTSPENASRLFNGSAAGYADIRAGLTFPRVGEGGIVESLASGDRSFAMLIGVAGVGKTSAARRVAYELAARGFEAWEHRPEYPFDRAAWLSVHRSLLEDGVDGVLVLDDCQANLGAINRLSEDLTKDDKDLGRGLRLVLTCGINQWRPRIKSPALFKRGHQTQLSALAVAEMESLLNLVQQQESIGVLVEDEFRRKSRTEQLDHLKQRCSADMYVCLKVIFGNDAIDNILLREYAELDEDLQDLYRHVAAIDATNGQVHRQLVISSLEIEASTVSSLLGRLEGIVDEYDIDAYEGLFGWQTRHRVVSRTIARYKFADAFERTRLIERTIRAANPTLWVDRRLLTELCDRDFGIGSLAHSDEEQIRLYKLIIEIAPRERVPRHRLIAKYLYGGQLDLAELECRSARQAVGLDPPISRYEVRLAVERARSLTGVLEEDRYAMLLEAEKTALDGVKTFPDDKYAYFAYVDVGVAMKELTGRDEVLENAVAKLKVAEGKLLDPDIPDRVRELEDALRTGRRRRK